jgi:hypothetical protein
MRKIKTHKPYDFQCGTSFVKSHIQAPSKKQRNPSGKQLLGNGPLLVFISAYSKKDFTGAPI